MTTIPKQRPLGRPIRPSASALTASQPSSTFGVISDVGEHARKRRAPLARHGRRSMVDRLLVDIQVGCVDVEIGLGVLMLVTIGDLLMPGPFGSMVMPPDWALSNEQVSGVIDVEFLTTAISAFLITATLALMAHVRGTRQGVRRGLIWATVLAVSYLVIGITNITSQGSTAGEPGILFDHSSLYVLLAATAAGPMVIGILRRPSSGQATARGPLVTVP
jgi:hypothetical protein